MRKLITHKLINTEVWKWVTSTFCFAVLSSVLTNPKQVRVSCGRCCDCFIYCSASPRHFLSSGSEPKPLFNNVTSFPCGVWLRGRLRSTYSETWNVSPFFFSFFFKDLAITGAWPQLIFTSALSLLLLHTHMWDAHMRSLSQTPAHIHLLLRRLQSHSDAVVVLIRPCVAPPPPTAKPFLGV